MSPEKEVELFNKYPKILNKECIRHIEVDDGWYSLIDNACSLIQRHLDLMFEQELTGKYQSVQPYKPKRCRSKRSSELFGSIALVVMTSPTRLSVGPKKQAPTLVKLRVFPVRFIP